MYKYSWLRTLILAFIFSSIGAGLTSVMVFGELIKLNANPSSFTLAFMLSITPGFIGSILGKHMLSYMEVKYCLIIAEVIGAIGLLIPWYGIFYSSATILQFSGITASFAAGILIPSINHYTKALLEEEDIGAAVVIDTIIFACHIVFGMSIGVFLYDIISNTSYLIANLIGYSLSIIFILFLPRLATLTKKEIYAKNLDKNLSSKQIASLYLMSALTIVGTPAISLLPTLVQSTKKDIILYLLLARSLGQLLGPFVVKEERYKNQTSLFIITCMAAFIICYLFIPLTTSLIILLLLFFFCSYFF
ncbi:MFS transporter [Bartonella sp. DGB1]|uniref:MFS transporter n=1 Tax=Bartonella sp. DGB1 TaxID=3239807 RepID=UPI0035257794